MSDIEKKHATHQAFLQAKHERLFNAPAEIIDAAILKATGSPALTKDRIIKGEANEVRLVKTEDGQEVIIRIGHNDWAQESFAKEKWAMEQCASIGVPVPTVLHLEYLELEGEPLAISIENKLAGVALNELRDWKDPANQQELADILKQAGSILAKIHSIHTQGFGDPDSNGNAPYQSVTEELSNEKYIQQDAMLEVAGRVNLDPKVILRALEILRQEWPKHPVTDSRLLHMDFGPKHISVDGDKISGILDFQNCEAGDRVKDFGWWEFYYHDKYPIGFLKAGYTDKSLFGSDFETRLFLWKIYLGLNNLSYYDKEKNSGGIDHCKRRLTEDITYFK